MGWELQIYKGIGYCIFLSDLESVFSEKEIEIFQENEIDGIDFNFQGNYAQLDDTSVLIGCDNIELLSSIGGSRFMLRGESITDFVAMMTSNDDIK
jgi:hypothetical protein